MTERSPTIPVNPRHAAASIDRGTAYQAKGNKDRAVIDFTTAIEIAPRVEAYKNRGNAYQAEGDFDRAIVDFDKAIQMNQTTLILTTIAAWPPRLGFLARCPFIAPIATE